MVFNMASPAIRGECDCPWAARSAMFEPMANRIGGEVNTIMKGRGIGREFYGKEKLEDLAQFPKKQKVGLSLQVESCLLASACRESVKEHRETMAKTTLDPF